MSFEDLNFDALNERRNNRLNAKFRKAPRRGGASGPFDYSQSPDEVYKRGALMILANRGYIEWDEAAEKIDNIANGNSLQGLWHGNLSMHRLGFKHRYAMPKHEKDADKVDALAAEMLKELAKQEDASEAA